MYIYCCDWSDLEEGCPVSLVEVLFEDLPQPVDHLVVVVVAAVVLGVLPERAHNIYNYFPI